MEILREYILSNERTPFFRCYSENSPNFGDIVSIRGVEYEILSSKYDYEVWQSTGIFVYTCRVKQCNVDSLLHRIMSQLSMERTIRVDSVDIINNSYPGGDVGDYMHDSTNYYLAVKKITLDSKEDVIRFETEIKEDKVVDSTFSLNCVRLDNTTFLLPKEKFKAKLYWTSTYITPMQIFNRDGKVDVMIQIVAPKGVSTDLDKFIKAAIHYPD